jgi:chromosome segregation ATPase
MDIQRTMEFIIEQQAANTADIAALKDSTRALHQNAVQLHESVSALATTAEHILDVQESHDGMLTALADSHLKLADLQRQMADSQRQIIDSQLQMADSQRQMADAHKKLAESQAETEDKLNALIDIVDRLFPKQ